MPALRLLLLLCLLSAKDVHFVCVSQASPPLCSTYTVYAQILPMLRRGDRCPQYNVSVLLGAGKLGPVEVPESMAVNPCHHDVVVS